jgi:hypothetical protein
MTDDESPIDKAFDLAPMGSQTTAVSTLIAKAHDDSAREDFTFARANVREVVENANDAIAKLAVIADQSQNPRAFEVLAKLMDTTVAASKHLLELQKEIRTIDKADVPHDEAAKSVTNNLFVGSTAELSKMLQSMKDKGQ